MSSIVRIKEYPLDVRGYCGFEIRVYTMDGEITPTGLMQYKAIVDMPSGTHVYAHFTVPGAVAQAKQAIDQYHRKEKNRDLHDWLTV